MSMLSDKTDKKVITKCKKALRILENEIDTYWDMTFEDDAALVRAINALSEIVESG